MKIRALLSTIFAWLLLSNGFSQSALWNEYLQSSPRGKGSTLANYSYAGYHYCAQPLPEVNATAYTYFDVTDYGAVPNDHISDRKAVLSTIAAAEKHNGKAVVFFPEGRYDLNSYEDFGEYPIVITKSNIVIKGAGQDVTELFFDQPAFLQAEPFIRFTPTYPNDSYWRGDEKLANVISYHEKGEFELIVSNGSKFKPGMAVNIDADLYTRSERGKGYFLPHDPPPGVDDVEDYLMEMHIVDRVVGNTVYFKEPVHLDLPHMQNAIIRNIKNIIEECGIEDLTLSGKYREQFKHHNGSRFGERYDMLVLQDARNCWVRNVRIKDYSSAIQIDRTMASSFLNINLTGHTGHNCVGGTASNGNLFMYMRENTQTHHGFGGDHNFVGAVFCRCNQFDGLEAHCAWPRANLYDMNEGGFEPRPGGARFFPHHGKDLCFWNWHVTKSGSKDFWPDGANYGYFMPPVIVGLYGETFSIPDKDKDLLAYESLGKKETTVESLFEAQLKDRLGSLPVWIKDQSDHFENVVRNAQISIASPSKFATFSDGQEIQVSLHAPAGFPKSSVKKIVLQWSKKSIYGGFETGAQSTGWSDQITFKPPQKGSVVLKAVMYYGNTEVEESLPITVFIGKPTDLNRIPVAKATMLPRDKRNELYGQFTAIGGAEASNFPQNSAYKKYNNGSMFYTVEKEFYQEQKKLYAKFGEESIKPVLQKTAYIKEAEKLIDNNASTTISNIYGNSMIQFDLGSEYNVGKLELEWNTAMSANVRLEVQTSNDAMAWYSFVNDEPLWEFGAQQIGQTLSNESLPNAKTVSIYMPQKRCRYIRLSTMGFPNNRLGEVRFYGTGIPKLKMLGVNGAAPYNWDTDKLDYEIQLKTVEGITYHAIPAQADYSVQINEPESYPGRVTFTVSDPAGASTHYQVNIIPTGEFMEDFEKASSGSIDGTFVGNHNVEWNIEGRFSSSMGTGKCIYFYSTQRGLETMSMPGGLSELAFDAENLTQSGGRNIKVSINNQVLIDSLYENEGVYRIKKSGLKLLGSIVIKIENTTEGNKKLGIDNIYWSGYAPDRNAYLKHIKIKGQPIDNFDRDSFMYMAPWDDSLQGSDITAEAESGKAKVQIDVQESDPPIYTFKVTADNGAWSEYRLVFRNDLPVRNTTKPSIKIYPNPASSILTLEGEAKHITMYDLSGKLAIDQDIHSNKTYLEVKHLATGTYILQMKTLQGETRVSKVVIE